IFFFQAEDGIRDFHVTGVQTCALPICADRFPCNPVPLIKNAENKGLNPFKTWCQVYVLTGNLPTRKEKVDIKLARPKATLHRLRSEERRVGKECISREFTRTEEQNCIR